MARLSDTEILRSLGELSDWKRSGNSIERTFEFPSFMRGIEFVNLVAQAAETADHHPDVDIRYTKVVIKLSSHDAGGVTSRDIKLARKIDELAR